MQAELLEHSELPVAKYLMKFFCDRCNAKYSISDEKVRGKVVKVRCKRCGDVITVSEKTNQPESSTPESEDTSVAPPPESETDGEWYYSTEGETFGPVAKERLVEKYKEGALTANSYVWKESFSGWKPATDVEPFATLLDEQAREVSGVSRPRRNTMDAGDPLEAIDPSEEGSRSLSGGLDSVASGDSDASESEGGAEDARSSSGSLPSVTGPDPSADGDSAAEHTASSDDSASEHASSNEPEADSGSQSTGGLGRQRSNPEDRGPSRRRRRRGSDPEPSGDSSSEDRRERLQRLRGKLKSNFGAGDETEQRREEFGAADDSDGSGELSESVGDEDTAERELEVSEDASAAAGEGDEGDEGDEAAAGSRQEEGGEPDEAAVELEEEDVEPDEALAEFEEDGAERDDAVVEPDEGGDEPDEAAVSVEPDADPVEELEEGEKTVDIDRQNLGALADLSEEGEPVPPEGDEDDDFSLPPTGSSRLDEEDSADQPEESSREAAERSGDGQSAEELLGELDDKEAKASLPTAPNLGDDGESDPDRSEPEGMTQSLLMQLDEIEEEGTLYRYVGAAAAVVMVAVAVVVTYIVFFSPDKPEDRKAEKDEPSPEEVAMAQEDEPVQKTYSKKDRNKILSVNPQKVEKKPEKGDEKEDESAENEGSAKANNGAAPSESGGDDSQEVQLVQTESSGSEDGPTMDGAKQRTGNDGSGSLREMEESGAVASAKNSDDSESEPGETSREFEAMQAVEGSSPSVENPTDSVDEGAKSGAGMPLSKDQIRNGIKAVRKSVGTCRRRHARRGTPIDVGKIYITLTIQPTGRVSDYEVSPEKLQGVVFERCLSSHKGRWHFGEFEGSSQQLKAPFIMQ